MLKTIGYLLLTLAFLAGAYVSSLSTENVIPWELFLPALGLGAIGVVLARIGLRRAATQEDKVAGHVETLQRSLDRIVENAVLLDGEKTALHPGDVHGRIDELFPEDLASFVEARQSIVHRFGLGAYASIMNEFAAGERYLNRVWSASVDGYIDDVHEYLARAREQFEKARAVLRSFED